MKTVNIASKILASSMVTILAITILPLAAFAQSEIKSTQIVQVAPAGTNTCAELTPRFQAYVYDGAINSFDISVSDPSYVAIVASVGDWSVPLNYMTRRVGPTATTVHMDTPSIPVGKGLPVTVILLSAKGQGAPLCAMTVTAVVAGKGISTVQSNTHKGGSYQSSGSAGWQEEETGSPVVVGEKEESTKPIIGGGLKSSLDRICSADAGATRLWTVLLAVYLLIIAATVLAQPASKPTNSSAAVLGAAIVLPLLVLLGIWGFAPDCRVGGWVPVAALVIAAAGCIFGYKNYPQFAKIFSSSESR